MNTAAQTTPSRRLHHLTRDGVSLVLEIGETVRISHWGAGLGEIDLAGLQVLADEALSQSGVDDNAPATFWREASRAHFGRPGLSGSRAGVAFAPLFTVEKAVPGPGTVVVHARDNEAMLATTASFAILPGGVLRVSQSLTNVGSSDYELTELLTWLPVPDVVVETLDFPGRWLRERQPERRPIGTGLWLRESREGRPGHDFGILQLGMTRETDFARGDVWAMAPAWSGNSVMAVERTPFGATAMGAGELLLPGEVRLSPGESYEAPPIIAAYADHGIDDLSARLHTWVRSRARHPDSPRPLTLNVWEAVYFDHSYDRLDTLVDRAAEIGIERFVLDDGWFLGRRDDTAGLGDWTVDPAVWPGGLHHLVDRVIGAGMQFGIWFEGEMVNLRSELAAEHPDWLLRLPGRLPPEARSQHTLDLVNPDAWAHIHRAVAAILAEYPVSVIKWDHNRPLIDAAHEGAPAVRQQTLALYRLFDALREEFPHLEIESCASGGGRIDLGMIEHADRFWTSDSNDAYERQAIQRYSSIAIPPELLGTHIGPSPAHSTGRHLSLAFRAIVALFGHAGVEWDLTATTPEERGVLRAWSDYYRRERGLLHSGRVIRREDPDGSALHGVIATDHSRALVSYLRLETSRAIVPARIRISGLDPDANYQVRVVDDFGVAPTLQKRGPDWMSGARLSGRLLSEVGLPAPILLPQSAILIELARI